MDEKDLVPLFLKNGFVRGCLHRLLHNVVQTYRPKAAGIQDEGLARDDCYGLICELPII